MVRKFNLLLILFFAFNVACATSIHLELQDVETENGKYVVNSGDSFHIIASVNDKDQRNEDLQIFGLDKFKVVGRSQARSISIINGQMSTKTDYIYNVYAEQKGQFKIGPAFIVKDDKRIDSNVLSVFVKTRSAGKPVSITTKKNISVSSSDSKDHEVFCRLNVQDQKIVVGQPTFLTASIYINGAILQVGLEPFKSSDFIIKEIEQAITRQENINGKTFNVLDKKFLITPLREGIKEIKPLAVEFTAPVYRRKRLGMFGDDFLPTGFFGSEVESKKAFSNSLSVDVQPLPKYSGSVDGVGLFDNFELTMDKKEVLINEPITIKLKLSGVGNLESITYPKLNVPSFCKFYESKFDLHQDLSSHLASGSKIFEYVLQAGKAGNLKIPEQRFVYFDTKSYSYKTLKTQSLEFKVNPGTDEAFFSQDILKNNDDKILNNQDEDFKNDINFIIEELYYNKGKDFRLSWWLFTFLILMTIIVFYWPAIFKFLNKFEKKYFYAFAKRKTIGEFDKRLNKIIRQQKIELLYQFYIDYFSFRSGLSTVMITENSISNKLFEFGWQEEKVSRFLDYLSKCAGLHFAIKDSNFKKQDFLNKAKYWFELLKD